VSDADETFEVATAPGHLIRRAQQLHASLWSERVADRLTSMQFAALAHLAQEPGIDQRALGRVLSIDPSTLAGVCRRLEQRGLLQRERAPADIRRYVLRLTPAGRALLHHAIPSVQAVGEELLGPLSAEERGTFMTLVGRLVDR
jgi:DNA-binding MarR family transcriptional regulator